MPFGFSVTFLNLQNKNKDITALSGIFFKVSVFQKEIFKDIIIVYRSQKMGTFLNIFTPFFK